MVNSSRQTERQKTLDENLKRFNDAQLHILEYIVGYGKTFQSLKMSQLDLSKKWLVVCWEVNHINSWKAELVKHNIDASKYEFITYASFTKTKGDYNLIFDECHHLNSKHCTHIINKLGKPRVICLSATIPDDRLLVIRGLAKWIFDSTRFITDLRRDVITLNESIQKSVSPVPIVNVIYTELNNRDKTEILEITKGGKNAKTVLVGDYSDRFNLMKGRKEYILQLNATEQQVYDYHTAQFEFWQKKYFTQQEEYIKFKFLRCASDRKTFLADSKTIYLQQILNYINKQDNPRAVVFTGSINQAKQVGGNKAVHSKLKRNEINDLIDSFNNKQIDKLFAVSMLREGVNLVDTPYGVITQLDNQSKSLNQMIGRFLRHDEPEVFILVTKNTQDEKYCETALNNISDEYINYLTFNEFLKLIK